MEKKGGEKAHAYKKKKERSSGWMKEKRRLKSSKGKKTSEGCLPFRSLTNTHGIDQALSQMYEGTSGKK